ncbi:MAG: nuclear transport factor 2 family protein [Candidatus Dormibacteria bacterium]
MSITADETAQNRRLVEGFYTAFQARDAGAMNACYAEDIHFRDPVFEQLQGDDARAMWSMLNAANSGLELTFKVGKVDAAEGEATWVAKYNFSATGRAVENHVTSHFWFRDGLIRRQEDSFSLYRWASQALGPQGQLLGWTPMVQSAIRKRARGNLDRFRAGQRG